jgi:hypothetical protein
LIAVTSVNITQTIKALNYSTKSIDFGEVTLVTHEKPRLLPKHIEYQHIDKISNIDMFNYAMVYDLYKYVHNEFAILVHADGFVVNPKSWKDEFMDYDYIGAPWPIPDENDKITYRDEFGDLYRVGNSVSIRSRQLMELPKKIGMKWEPFHGWYNEDGFICVNRRKEFEKYGCKYAEPDLAAHFSQERMTPECEGVTPFCFHKWDGKNSKYPKFSKIPIIPF